MSTDNFLKHPWFMLACASAMAIIIIIFISLVHGDNTDDCPLCLPCPHVQIHDGREVKTLMICVDGEMNALVPYGSTFEAVPVGFPCPDWETH